MVEPHESSAGAGRPGSDPAVTTWVGWVLFGGIVMVIVGIFNVIEGLVALLNEDYYVVAPSGLVVEVSYTVWGWTLLVLGAILVLTGWGAATGRTWARVLGVIIAVVNAVVNLGFMAAYPIWSVLAIALDVIVIYALVAHGREAQVFRS
jgi:hypothetical protein